jgi:PAS domain S-box-containing protein
VAEDNRALARSLTATLESITDAFYTLDREWRFTYVNHEAERIMVRRRDELLGRSLHDLFPGFADTEFGRQFAHALRGDQPVQFEAFYPPLARWFEARAFPSAQGLAVYFRDITPERTSAAQLRALMLKVESVQDAERSAIARDVHDELGQALTVLRMDATRLSRLTAATPAAAELVAEMTAAIDHTLQEARSIATALHPTALDDLGLNAAVEIHATQVARRAGLALTLDLAPTSLRVDRARAGAAYRVLQESLTNVVRHAAASSVVVRLGQSGSDLVLEIADDGRGMPPGERRRHGSLGLLGMRERAVVFGGSVDIGAASSGGTVVTLRLPLASLTSDVGQGPTRSSDNVP